MENTNGDRVGNETKNPATGSKSSNNDVSTFPAETSNDHKEDDLASQTSSVPFSKRFKTYRFGVIAVLLFLGMFGIDMSYRSLPFAVICMSDSSTTDDQKDNTSLVTNSSVDCQMAANDSVVTVNSEICGSDDRCEKEFQWGSSTQGIILASTNVLRVLGVLLSQPLVHFVGLKTSLLLIQASHAICMLLSPPVARLNVYPFIALRVISGFSNGAMIPISFQMVVWWSPFEEKAMIQSFMLAGLATAGIVSPIISGYLCSIPIDRGWPFIFYVFGSFMILWCVVWQTFSTSTPESNKFMSEKEKAYILKFRKGMTFEKTGPAPLRKIVCSLPVWGLVVSVTAFMWSQAFTQTVNPLYLNEFGGFSVEETGMVATAGDLSRLIFMFIWGTISKVASTRVKTTRQRKLVFTLGIGMSSLGFLGLTLPGVRNRWVTVILVCMQAGGASAVDVSAVAVPLDMAPRYTGIITAMFMTPASITTVMPNIIAGLLVKNNTAEEWRNVYIIATSVAVFGIVTFDLMVKAELQPWAFASDIEEDILVPENPNGYVVLSGEVTDADQSFYRFDFTNENCSGRSDTVSIIKGNKRGEENAIDVSKASVIGFHNAAFVSDKSETTKL